MGTPTESLIISKKTPSAVRLHFSYSVSSSISEGSGYFKMQSSCEFDFTGTKKKHFFCTLSLSLSVGSQRLEIWDLCLCFDSVIRLVLADCQMSPLPNIVLRICLHISPEPTSSQIVRRSCVKVTFVNKCQGLM